MLPDDCFLHETLSSNLFKLNCLINHYYYIYIYIYSAVKYPGISNIHQARRVFNTIASDVPGGNRIPKVNIKAQQSAFSQAIETKV